MSLGGSSGDFTLIGASVRLSHHFGSGSTRLRTKFPFSAALASTALTIQRQVARGFLLWTGADREPATPPGGRRGHVPREACQRSVDAAALICSAAGARIALGGE